MLLHHSSARVPIASAYAAASPIRIVANGCILSTGQKYRTIAVLQATENAMQYAMHMFINISYNVSEENIPTADREQVNRN